MSSPEMTERKPDIEESTDGFAVFGQGFPSSPFGDQNTLGQLSGHNNTFLSRDRNQLVKEPSGHSFKQEISAQSLQRVSGHNLSDPTKPPAGLSGHNLSEQKLADLPEPGTQHEDTSTTFTKPLQFRDSDVFDLDYTSGTTMPLSGEITERQETEHEDDDEQSITADDDQLLIGKTTEDGTQYLELSFESLDFDLVEQGKDRKNASSAGSCISKDTGTNKRERRRGRRRDHGSSDLGLMGQNGDPVKDSDKNSDTVKLEDDERSANSAASKGRRRKKHHKRRSSKKDKKKKKSKKSEDSTRPNLAEEYPSGNLVLEHSSGDLVSESVDNLDELLDDAIEAELVLVGDMWMAGQDQSKGRQTASKLADLGNTGTDVRNVKLSVSMPGDNELFSVGDDNVDQDRRLLEILDIDPWDREGSSYSNAAAMAALEREPGSCAEKHEFDAFGHKLYPFAMLCAIGASLEVVQRCYDKYPQAIGAKDPTDGTPLHYACAYAGSAELVQWLIEKKPDQLNEVDLLQRSPFHVACLYSARCDILKILVAKSPEGLEVRDYESNTTLHVAAEHDAPAEVLEFLAKESPLALVTRRKDGSTPLHLALDSGVDPHKIKSLLNVNYDALKIPDDKGQLPIHTCLFCPTVDAKTVTYLSQSYPEGLKMATKAGETPHCISKRLKLKSSIRALLKC